MAEKVKTNTNRITHNNNFLAALAFIVMGVVFCYTQSASIFSLALIIFGTILAVLGLLEIYYKNIIVGIVEVVLGVALIVVAVLAGNVSLIIMGIAVLLFAVFFLVINLDTLKKGSILHKIIVILALLFMLVVAALFIAAYCGENSRDIIISLGAFCLGSGVAVALRNIL